MYKSCFIFSAVSLLLAQPWFWYDAVPVSWGELTEGWQLAAFTEKQSFSIDEPVLISLVVRSARPGTVRLSLPKSSLNTGEFVVKRVGLQANALARRPAKSAWEKLRQAGTGSYGVSIEPGGMVRPRLVDLRDVFDLPPGTYTVQGVFRLPDSNEKTRTPVVSNEITLTVVAR